MFCEYGYWFNRKNTEIQLKEIFLFYHLRKNIDSYETGADQSIRSPVLSYGFVKYVHDSGIQVTHQGIINHYLHKTLAHFAQHYIKIGDKELW
jgi:hypothetical protein